MNNINASHIIKSYFLHKKKSLLVASNDNDLKKEFGCVLPLDIQCFKSLVFNVNQSKNAFLSYHKHLKRKIAMACSYPQSSVFGHSAGGSHIEYV